MVFTCGTCWKIFPAGCSARDSHCQATGHDPPRFECDTCDAYFGSERARCQHMDARGHCYNSWKCHVCDDTWQTEEELQEHEHEDHLYCADHERFFQNENNLRAHLRSRAHLGSDAITCPFCQGGFTTAAGMTHHLERGACPSMSGIDRDDIYRMVRAKDPNGLISKKLIGWTGDTEHEASDQAWNGWAWECYFCDKKFEALKSLNQHLNSPKHKADLYHCPKCGRDFKTLAAAINHLESESCGAMRFDTVQRKFRDIVSSDKLLTF